MAFWSRRHEQRSTYSISDPTLAMFFGVGAPNYSGVSVSESSALGLSAFWRAISLISGTIASLPMRTLRDSDDGTRVRIGSFLDNPGGPDGPTPFEWTETVLADLLVHGNAFLAHVFNQGGGIAALVPIHPLSVSIELDADVLGGRVYQVSLVDGTRRTFTTLDMTHIPSLTLNGDGTGRGLSLISVARNSLGTGIAGDRAAARQFGNGAMISGLVTPEEDVTEDEARQIKEGLNAKIAGVDNAGDIAVINRRLKLTPWSMTNEDAQFIESRAFQIEEVSRWTGVPPHLLGQTDKQTSWGTGVESQNRALARTVLAPWAARIEQRLSRLLPSPRYVLFDFAGLERPTPETEIALLIQQVDAGLMTPNEARRFHGMDPLPGGDTLRVPSTVRPPGSLAVGGAPSNGNGVEVPA
jgi:HK97 family phage portal protein